MDVREKLVELVENGHGYYYTEEYKGANVYAAIADHLIANGVTVQEWISVKDRLPEMQTFTSDDPKDPWEYDCSQMILAYTDDGVRIVECCIDANGTHWATEGGTDYDVTHWMPLPQPPKGE